MTVGLDHGPSVVAEDGPDVATRPQAGRELVAQRVQVAFGGVQALDRVSLRVPPGKLHGLVGPNGAGKTTLFNVLTGQQTPDEGLVELDGKDVTHFPPSIRARLGVGRCFQIPRLIESLSVRENLLVGRYAYDHPGLLSCLLHGPRARRHDRHTEAVARGLAQRLGLLPWWGVGVRNLPYGLRRMVDVGRALMASPTVLLLDEPAAGLSPSETAAFGDLLLSLQASTGITILLIEHDLSMVRQVCEEVSVLVRGKIVAAGGVDAALAQEDVVEAFVGRRRTRDA